MAKEWTTTNIDNRHMEADNEAVSYNSDTWAGGDVILRTLVNVAIQTVQLALPPTHGLTFPPVGVAIGYDPFSNHLGEIFTPINQPHFDWMYTEVFPWNVSVSNDASPPDIYYTAGTTFERSVQSQRRLSEVNTAPFVVAYITTPTPFPIDIQAIPVAVSIRTLVDIKH